ncbi:hypothetical protein [Acinetobacter sp. ANC 4640]
MQTNLETKQKYWREQLPKFEAKYWLPDHFSFLNFDMEQGNYVVKEDLDSIYEDDATEIYHRVNTGWAMWKKCESSMKAEIDELKAELEKAQAVPEGFVVVPKEPTEEILSKAIRKYLEVSDLSIITSRMRHIYKLIVDEAAQGEGNE